MAESSSAQEQSAQAPPSPIPPPTDPRNDSVEVEDSAPLLSSNDGAPRARISEAIRVLTSIALSSSILTLILLIATHIILEVVTAGDFTFAWQTRKGMEGVIAPAVFSLLISAYNLNCIPNRRAMAPPALNLLFDVLIAFFAIAYGFSGLFAIPDGNCYGDGSYETCTRHTLPARILAGITLGMGIIFGFAHLIIGLLRCRVILRSEFWKRPWNLSFPNGQLTLQFSFKLFKEPQKPRDIGEETV